jgi:hypothetical protein
MGPSLGQKAPSRNPLVEGHEQVSILLGDIGLVYEEEVFIIGLLDGCQLFGKGAQLFQGLVGVHRSLLSGQGKAPYIPIQGQVGQHVIRDSAYGEELGVGALGCNCVEGVDSRKAVLGGYPHEVFSLARDFADG